jgi:hypothetical protein
LRKLSRRSTLIVVALIGLTHVSGHDARAQATTSSSSTPTFAGITGDGTSVGLSWWAVKGATKYEVLRTSDPQRTPTTIASVPSTTLGYRDQRPATGTVFYQLVAVLAGGTRATGAWVEYASPTITSAIVAGSDVVLAWSGVKNVPGGYEIWRTMNRQQPGSRVAALGSSALSYRVKQAATAQAATAQPATAPFYYQVVAVGRGGLRAASPWILVNTSSGSWAQSAADKQREEAAVAALLAEELKKVGVSVDDTELAAITDAIVQGGAGAMALAMFIEQKVAEFGSTPGGAVPEGTTGGGGDPTTQATGDAVAPAFQKQVDSIIRDLSSGPNASLAISQILLRKLKQSTKK